MPRASVKTSYQPVRRKQRPRGRRKAQEATVFQFGPRSRLGRYLFENADSGLPVWELVQQFQEYDCEHEFGEEPLGSTLNEILFQCQECGVLERKRKPGVRKDDVA